MINVHTFYAFCVLWRGEERGGGVAMQVRVAASSGQERKG